MSCVWGELVNLANFCWSVWLDFVGQVGVSGGFRGWVLGFSGKCVTFVRKLNGL